MTRRPLKDAQAAHNYVAKLDDMPRYFEQQTVNMRAGLKRGFSVPRAVLDGRDVSIANYAEVKSPEDSEFYAPLKKLPSMIPADEQAKLRADAVRAIREHVIPSYAKLLKFFREDYVPHARKTLAAEAMPNGKDYYRQQIREYTTLESRSGGDPPDRPEGSRTHRRRHAGDDEGQWIHRRFSRVPAFPAHRSAVLREVRDELLMRAAWIAKQVDGKLSRFFGCCRVGVSASTGAARNRTVLDGGPRRRAYLLGQYLRPASRPLYNLPR